MNVTETVIDLRGTPISPPKAGSGSGVWCFESEYYAGVTDDFDAEAVKETLTNHPCVIDAWVEEKPGIEWTDIDPTTTYRVKINGWMSGDGGKHAARVGYAHFGEWVDDQSGVLGHSNELAQPVGRGNGDELHDANLTFKGDNE